MKNSPRKKEKSTMAKRHNTGWDMLTCCIFTMNFQEASEQEIWICTYIAYSEWQHYFLFLIIKTTCWLTVYHDKLLKLKNSHPNIYEEFKNGCFSLKRTSKPFSMISIDLTLEQTINTDAACQHSGWEWEARKISQKSSSCTEWKKSAITWRK